LEAVGAVSEEALVMVFFLEVVEVPAAGRPIFPGWEKI
jgi:hypothetical protein